MESLGSEDQIVTVVGAAPINRKLAFLQDDSVVRRVEAAAVIDLVILLVILLDDICKKMIWI